MLVVSAGDEAAGRLLRTMQQITTHPLLAGSVVDETQHRIILSNGSEIRSVPASERQIRGWTTDLLICDEAAFLAEDLLLSAALPTTAARPDGRTVLASTPWGTEGAFYALAMEGLREGSPHVRTFRWALKDATWIAPEVIETARATMPPIRFRAEYEGEWAPAGDAYFDSEDILACAADFPMLRDGGGAPAVCGLDWGRQRDAHAVAVTGLLDDCGANGRPVVILAWCETSRRPYGQQLAEIESLTAGWALTVYSETNGVGAYPSEELAQRLPQTRVVGVASTQSSKEDSYGRLGALLAQRAIVLPNHPELLRQLGGVSATPTPSGGLRIGARVESIHDDLPDALALAVAGLPRQLAEVPPRGFPEDQEWAETPGGVRVPIPVRTLEAEMSYLTVYGDLVKCRKCGQYNVAARPACRLCGAQLQEAAKPAGQAAATKPAAAAQRRGAYAEAYDLRRCEAGHTWSGRYHDACPQCRRGGGQAYRRPAA